MNKQTKCVECGKRTYSFGREKLGLEGRILCAECQMGGYEEL